MTSPAQGSTDARRRAADHLRGRLPDISVWDVWPTKMYPPGVIVTLGGYEQRSSCLFTAEVTFVCVAPAGDNDGSMTALETLADRVTVAAGDTYGRVSRDAPVQTTIAGAAALTITVRTQTPIVLGGI